jgi:hypothetical protein
VRIGQILQELEYGFGNDNREFTLFNTNRIDFNTNNFRNSSFEYNIHSNTKKMTK